MIILNEKINVNDLPHVEETTYFEDMVKCVVDTDRELIAINAELDADPSARRKIEEIVANG